MVVGDVTTAVDVLVLGAGPGGYVAAIRAAQLGRKVTLVDAGAPGGTCLHAGCIPLKALLSASERYAQARGDDLAAMGITSEHVTFDWSKMQAWKQSVVQRLSEGVRRLLLGNGVEYVHGTGWFINDQEVRVEGEHGSLRFKFDACVIATGAESTPLAELPYNGSSILTPEQALALPELPASLSIFGDNYIALELATLFARLMQPHASGEHATPHGSSAGTTNTQVRLYTPGAQLLPDVDPAALRLLQAAMRKQGIAISTQAVATEIQERPLIIAQGGRPRVSGLRLDAAGVQLHPAGGIGVDRQQRSSQPRIFAVGDCASGSAGLASWASKQGKVAAEVIAGQRVQFAPLVTPLVVHTTPEIAIIRTSTDLEQTTSGRFPLAANGRALTLGTDNGIALLNAASDGTLIDATVVGPRAGDISSLLALALEMAATLTDLSEILYAHPGLSEIILEASEQAQGKAIHTLNKTQ